VFDEKKLQGQKIFLMTKHLQEKRKNLNNYRKPLV